jgi:ABC-type nitrate/sulfonate/bicarbonate transport system permease component
MKKVNLEEMSEHEIHEYRLSILYKILPVVSLILLAILWVIASGQNPNFPSPAQVWARFLLIMEKPIKGHNIFGHVLASLRRVLIAMLIAWALGIGFGILTGWNKKAYALLNPMFTAFRSVPPLAWIPLITIWFGTGEGSKILVVLIGSLAAVAVNTQAGMSNVNKQYLDVGTVFNATPKQRLFYIAIPSALDAIFAGLRTSTSAAWMVVLAAEMLGGKSGVGFLITRGMDSMDYPLCLLSMIFIGIVGYLLAGIMQVMEGVVCPWTKKRSS